MKKFLMLFFIFSIFSIFVINFNINICIFAKNIDDKFNIYYQNKNYNFDINSLYMIGEKNGACKNLYSNNLDYSFKKDLIDKILKMGFSIEDTLNYCFYGLKEKYAEINKSISYKEKNSEVKYNKNNNTFYKTKSSSGLLVDKEKFYLDLFNCIKKQTNNIKIKCNKIYPQIIENNLPLFLRSEFATFYENSSESRKHNIKTAIAKLAGVKIESGETLSFNKIIGQRNENAGYVKSKIIVGGKYVEGIGGGVCQVSTTMYNACLLSGLEIVESHPHSLRVGYVEPGFDAMVNYSSADLKVKNNTDNTIYISAKCSEKSCKISIFGEKYAKNIQKRSEIIKTLPAPDYEYVYDYTIKDCKMQVGDYKILTKQKDGLVVMSYIDIYEKNKKTKSILLRKSYYAPERGKMVVGTCLALYNTANYCSQDIIFEDCDNIITE